MGRKVWIQPKDGWVYTQKQEAPRSPIRSRREIVPGVYGKVCINECGAGGGIESIEMMRTLSAEELREAAHLFNQIAEVLEENAE